MLSWYYYAGLLPSSTESYIRWTPIALQILKMIQDANVVGNTCPCPIKYITVSFMNEENVIYVPIFKSLWIWNWTEIQTSNAAKVNVQCVLF
jgi:hypothetical protein